VDKGGCHNAAVENFVEPSAPCAARNSAPVNYSSKVDEYNKQVHGIEKKGYSGLVERLVTLD
jgi:hypothetical protein